MAVADPRSVELLLLAGASVDALNTASHPPLSVLAIAAAAAEADTELFMQGPRDSRALGGAGHTGMDSLGSIEMDATMGDLVAEDAVLDQRWQMFPTQSRLEAVLRVLAKLDRLSCNDRHGLEQGTVLHHVAMVGSGLRTIQTLIGVGCDPTVRDQQDRTPFDVAHRHSADSAVLKVRVEGPEAGTWRRRVAHGRPSRARDRVALVLCMGLTMSLTGKH